MSVQPSPLELFIASPALFAANEGQVPDASVRYAFQGSGANVLLTDKGPVFQVFQAPTNSSRSPNGISTRGILGGEGLSPSNPSAAIVANSLTQSEQFSVNFLGAALVAPVGLDQASTVYNYEVGDRSQWYTDVPTYEQVAYRNLYSGIDLVNLGQQDSLKYEFHVASEADWSQIRIHYNGIEGLFVDDHGTLHVRTALGQLTDSAPVIYQKIGGRQVPVAGRFQLIDADT